MCVITSVIRPGYGPPASKWTLYPIQLCWQQRRQALADYGFDGAARSLCFMERYFWLRNNLLELFNLSGTMTCTISAWSHTALVCHIRHTRDEYILNWRKTLWFYIVYMSIWYIHFIVTSCCDGLVTCLASLPSSAHWCLLTMTEWTWANDANEWIISASVNIVYPSPVPVLHLDATIQEPASAGGSVTRQRRTHRHTSPLGLGSSWSTLARATCPYYCLWQNQEGNASIKSACVVPARQILLAVPPM